jgi:hypothetical protein
MSKIDSKNEQLSKNKHHHKCPLELNSYKKPPQMSITPKISKKYKLNQAIHKCYLWPMIYFVKPYSTPPDFM